MEPSRSETKQLAMQGTILVLASFAVRFIGFFYRIPLTNLWGDAGNDAYSMAYQIYNLCIIISSFGVPSTISRMIGQRVALKQYAEAKRVVKVAFVLVGGISILCALFLWFGANWIATSVFGVEAARLAIKVQAPTLIIVGFMSVLRGLFQGMNNMKPTAISQLLEQIVNAATSLIFAYALFGYGLDWGVAGGISGAAFGGLAALIFLFFCYSKSRSTSWTKDPLTASKYATQSNKSILKEMLMLMIPIVLATSVMNIKSIIDSSLFIRLMKWKGYASEVASSMRGIYQGKFVLLTTLPIAIGNALGTASVPSIAKSITLKEYDEVHKKITLQVKTILLISIPCAVGLAVIAKPLLLLLYPNAPDGYQLFWVGTAQVVFYSLMHVSNGILQGIAKVRIPVKNAGISAVISFAIFFVLVLVLDLNVYALVINDMIFSGIMALLDVRAVCRYGQTKIQWRTILIKPLISALIMGAICLLSYWGVHALIGSNLVALVVAILLAILVYFGVLVNIGGITEEDMDNLPLGRKLSYLRIRRK